MKNKPKPQPVDETPPIIADVIHAMEQADDRCKKKMVRGG